MRLLVFANQGAVVDKLVQWLRNQSHTVQLMPSLIGPPAAFNAAGYNAAILILDPCAPAPRCLNQLRSESSNLPVVAVTLSSSHEVRVSCLDAGADDCISCPFDMAELEARLRVLVRRKKTFTEDPVLVGALQFDRQGQRALVGGEDIRLSASEIKVLDLLIARMGRVVSKQSLADVLYPAGHTATEKSIEIHMCRLRKKLKVANVIITTVRDLGYLLERPRMDQ
jgi:two-component system OmpR family response regulator